MKDAPGSDRKRLFAAWFLTRIACAFLCGIAVGGGCVVEDPDYCNTDDFCQTSRGPEYMCSGTLRACVLRGPNSCSKNDDCTDLSLPLCDLGSKRCVPCVPGESGDQACSRFGDTPICGTAQGSATRCVACLQNSHCPAAAPVCENQTCRKCTKHSDCEGTHKCHDGTLCTDSLVCIGEGELTPGTEGRCALNGDRGQIVYVRKTTDCKNAGTDGGNLVTQPFCDVELGYLAAVMQTNRTYIRVVGDNSPSAYFNAMPTPIDKGKFVFIGSPVLSLQVSRPARILSRGTSFQTIFTANVTVDEFSLALDLPSASLLQCAGSSSDMEAISSLTVRNSTLEGLNLPAEMGISAGIAAHRCNLRVYNNIIGVQSMADVGKASASAFDTGIGLATDRFSPCKKALKAEIWNNVIAGNINSGIDLSSLYCPLWTVDIRFNTIVGNGRRPISYGGVYGPTRQAPMVNVRISQSLFRNPLMSGTQVTNADAITWKDVVISSDDSVAQPGIIKADFELDPSFALKSSSAVNSSCCIDKAQPATGETFPAFDLAGNPRPKGSAYDIGAFEVK